MTNNNFIKTLAIILLLFFVILGGTGCGGGSSAPIKPDNSIPVPDDENEISLDQVVNPEINPTPTPNSENEPTFGLTTYSVVFDSDGGSYIPTQTIISGNTANMPAIPKKADNLFIGWYLANKNNFSFKFNFDTPISQDIILHAKWYDKTDTTDSDGDGLPDTLELAFGTDPLKPDTDDDGLTDFNEINWLNYNPLVQDTNANGILDGDEDHDGDGLTNIREQELKTNMILSDTDLDGLTDYDEVTTYKTDPLNLDTDGDEVDDGTEVAIGSNPLIAETTFTTKLGSSFTNSNPKAIDVNVEMASSAKNAGILSIKAVNLIGHPLISIATPGYISNAAYEITTENSNDIEAATLTFTLGSDYQETESFKPRIYYLNEEKGIIEKVENQNVNGNTISANLTHFSIYALLNSVEFDSALNYVINFIEDTIAASLPEDSNHDGLSDYYTEAILNGNILLQDGSSYLMCVPETSKDLADWDGDGLLNGEEIYVEEINVNTINGTYAKMAYVVMNSDPLNPDTDGDGYSDYDEVKKMITSPTKITRPWPGTNKSTTLNDIKLLNDIFPEKYVEMSTKRYDVWQDFSQIWQSEGERIDVFKKIFINYFDEYSDGTILARDAEAATRQMKCQYWLDGLKLAGTFLQFSKSTINLLSDIRGGKYSESFRTESDYKEILGQLEQAEKLANKYSDLMGKAAGYDLLKLYDNYLEGKDTLDKASSIRDTFKGLKGLGDDIKSFKDEVKKIADTYNGIPATNALFKALTSFVGVTGQVLSVLDKFDKIDIAAVGTWGKNTMAFRQAHGMEISVGMTVVLDILDMAKSMVDTAYIYGKIEANYAEYRKNLDILTYLEFSDSSYAGKAAACIREMFYNNGTPNWNEFNRQLNEAMQTQVEAGTFKLLMDGIFTAASAQWPALGLTKAIFETLKGEFIDSYVDALSKAQVYYALVEGSNAKLSVLEIQGAYFEKKSENSENMSSSLKSLSSIELANTDETDIVNRLRTLAQARIMGLNEIGLYETSGNIIKKFNDKFHIFGDSEEEKEKYRKAIGRFYDFVNSCSFDVSSKLPGYDSEYNKKTINPDTPTPDNPVAPDNPDTPTPTPVTGDISIDEVHFPDDIFRTYVQSNFDTDNNYILSVAEIAKVTKIDVSFKNISSLNGIEYFTALTYLNCHYNQLTALDVSKNTTLAELLCYHNQLTALNIKKNTALAKLNCYQNQLTTLDLSNITALTYLNCEYNQLKTLDVSKNTALTYLKCDENQLTTLNISNITALTYLDCSANQLTILDVSKNTALTELWCSNNLLTTLDLSNCPKLNSNNVYCGNGITITWAVVTSSISSYRSVDNTNTTTSRPNVMTVIASIPKFTATRTGEYVFDVPIDQEIPEDSRLILLNNSDDLNGIFINDDKNLKVSANFEEEQTYSPVIVAESEAVSETSGGGCDAGTAEIFTLIFVGILTKRRGR